MTHFQLNPDGTFTVLNRKRIVLDRACARLLYRDEHGQPQIVRTSEQVTPDSLYGSDGRVKMELRFTNDSLMLTCQNSGDAPIFLDACELLYCDAAENGVVKLPRASELLYLHHGWQSWSQTEIREMRAPEIPYNGDDFFEKHLPYGAPAPNERTSNAFTLIARTGQESATLLGFETGANQFSQIRFELAQDKIARVRAVAYADGAQLDPLAEFTSESLVIFFGDAGELYDVYAQRVGNRMGRRGARKTIQGWCSWYYYFNMVTADHIRANMNAMQAQNLPLDVVLVDDGYETAIGDWTSIEAEKFPQGMKQIADEIHAAGKLAGIWLAPFGASSESQLAKQHPEFFLRDENNNPVCAWKHWGEQVYALDVTRNDVGDWLFDLFHTICHVWGYDAVKLDFVFAGALAGTRADVYATRAQAYRRGLEIIGKAVGNEKIILGCGAPQLQSVGLVDTMRVSQDVNFTWLPDDAANGGAVSTQHAIQNTLLRAPFNQRWWLNDPDCVIVRRSGDLNDMTRNENRSLASIAALTGSILLDSDNLANLNRASLNDLRRILPAPEKTARVRKWFARADEQPCELELKRDDGTWILASINWSHRTRETVIELPGDEKFRVYDFWSKKDLGILRGRVKILKHAPHQTIVLHCIPIARKTKQRLQHIAAVTD